MLCLAVECSLPQGSIALISKQGKEHVYQWNKTHGEEVVAGIDLLLNQSACSLKYIELLAVSVGPGRFTGLRVALNAVKALAYSLDKDIVCFNSLELLAENADPTETSLPVLTLINAFKNMVFAGVFRSQAGRWICEMEPQAMTFDEANKTFVEKSYLCLGDGCTDFLGSLQPEQRSRFLRDPRLFDYPSALTAARLTALNQGRGRRMNWRKVTPLYIRTL